MINVLRQYTISGRKANELAASVERAIMTATLHPGDRLPTVRALAAKLNISPATVAAGFALLRRRGLVSGDGRSGTTVCASPPLAGRGALLIPGSVHNLALGNPDPMLLPNLADAV